MEKAKMMVQSFNLWYGKKPALKEVNLAISENQIMGLIGPSGCGKSTFLRSLNRMNDLIETAKMSGSIYLDDENIYDKNYDVVTLRKKVGMVFQKPNPFPKTIFENVVYGPRIHGIKNRKELMEIAEKSLVDAALWEEVKDDMDRSAFSLSGGQQQRLCIARVLAVEPDVLLMDEPTSALDPVATQKIEDLLIHLRSKFTIVIVTHNMQQAARISETTAFFLNGEIIESGETGSLFTSPKDKRTDDYISGKFG